MNTIVKTTLLVMLVAMTGTTLAAAEEGEKPLFSVTPYLGMGLWSDDVDLDNSILFGGRGAFHFTERFSLEGTYGMSSADRSADGVGVDLKHYGADLVWELVPRGRFTPYLAAGWAQIDYDADGGGRTEVLNGAEAGIGVKTRLWGGQATGTSLRLDVRDVMSNLTPAFANDGGLTHNWIATAGLQFSFGRSGKDTDGDGVRDRDDACVDTPPSALVDETGCPLDTDGDGVFDGLDECNDTPMGALVDRAGCAMDTDGDGVFDGLDRCEGTEDHLQVDEHGCPIEVVEMKTVPFEGATVSNAKIHFDIDSVELGAGSSRALSALVAALKQYPAMKIEIIGHADDTGSTEYNQGLSERRAEAVKTRLMDGNPDCDGSRIATAGRGEDEPVSTNDTDEGRSANRRVEFRVLNADELTREVEVRKLLER